MFKLFIVDDEPIIIEGLKAIIKWEEYGIEICGTALSAESALIECQKCCPDILITDVRMSGMNGLELIKQLSGIQSNMRSVVLSGYDDFEYLKESIKLGIENYIMKPVSKDELKNTIMSIVNKIIEDNRKDIVLKDINIIRDNLLSRWLKGEISSHELSEKAEMVGICLDYTYYCVVLVKPRINTLSNSFDYQRMLLVCSDIFGEYTFWMSNRIAIVLSGKSFHNEYLISMLECAVKKAEEILGFSLCVSLGNVVEDYFKLNKSYKYASELLEYFMVYTDKRLITEIPMKREETLNLWNEFDMQNIEKAYVQEDSGLLEQLITDMVSRLGYSGLRSDVIKEAAAITALKLVSSANRFLLHEIDIDSEGVRVSDVFDMQSLDEIKAFLLELLRKIFASIRQKDENTNPIVKRVLKYIESNYKEGISLKTIASEYKITPSYLGQVFRESTGEYFSDYLNRYRIECAKKLLQSNMDNVRDIGKEVGYVDPNYFFKLFKKYTEMTPAEYRSRVAKI